jgi:hypothetical protein
VSMPRRRPALRSRARSWAVVSGGRGGGGRGGQDGAGVGAHDAAARLGEGGEEGGIVLAQVGADLVVRGGARPHGVLLGAIH